MHENCLLVGMWEPPHIGIGIRTLFKVVVIGKKCKREKFGHFLHQQLLDVICGIPKKANEDHPADPGQD